MRAAVDVLVIDRSERDARTTLSGIRIASETATVLRLKTVAEALEYIHRKGTFADRAPRPPQIVLLEIELGNDSGLALLDRLQSDTDTRAIPVIILAASSDSQWVDDALARGSRGYVVKPANKAEYMAKVAELIQRWVISTGSQ